MNLIFKKSLFAALVVLFASSCKEELDFPLEPIIKTKSFNIEGDSIAYWVFSFTDGDGDLGSSDTSKNFFPKLHYINGDSTRALENASLPKINTSGKTKSIEGEITQTIELDFFLLKSTDTVYISAFVKDQAGRTSNEIKTPIFKIKPVVYFENPY